MSFAKAKIQRFNDIKDCTPSPAKYNVQTQEKIKSGVIPQLGKYVKKTGSCSGSETGSVHSTPIFQTPTVPKKKKFLGLMSSTSKSKSNDQQEELREKIVECTNKDIYIRDLTEQIEELKEKINVLEQEKVKLAEEKSKITADSKLLQQQQQNQINFKYATLYQQIKEVKNELSLVRNDSVTFKNENCKQECEKLLNFINKFQKFNNQKIKNQQDEAIKKEEKIREEHKKEMEILRKHLEEKAEEANLKLSESEAKINQLKENFKEANLLNEMQIKEKLEQVEAIWKSKLEEKEKEHEAILKECQEISEYNIIQSEIEKNLIKTQLEEQKVLYDDLLTKHNILETKYNKADEDVNNLLNEKHAYEVSITTFRDTIEVLKKRLINSDRDVEQLKEELGKCEEKILVYEKKNSELLDQLNEMQVAKEELEMQYESTSKIMQNQVKTVEKSLLNKVEGLQEELKQLLKDRALLNEIMEQHHQQQSLLSQAQDTIGQSRILLELQDKKNEELHSQLEETLKKLSQESEEAAEIRKKFIEKSGKYDILWQQFVELTEDLKKLKEKNKELQNLVAPYQEQLEAYDSELKITIKEKQMVENEVKELTQKYAEIVGHQNHNQKIKHISDLKMKSSEMFEKNMELEARNFKLNKLVEKLKKEIEDLRKGGKKMVKVACEDKENLGSPKCLQKVQSPGPLKEKN